MNELYEDNFRDLLRLFEHERLAKEVRSLETYTASDARGFLTTPSAQGVTGFRNWYSLFESLQDLLGLYALLEIGYHAGFLSDPPEDLKSEALRCLESPVVQEVIQFQGGLILPQLFHRRLVGAGWPNDETEAPSFGLYSSLVDLVDEFQRDLSLIAFRRVLDNAVPKWSTDAVLTALAEPNHMLDLMGASPEEPSIEGQSLEGVLRFLEFSFSLSDLLTHAGNCPLFRSATWHCFAPWYGARSGKLEKFLHGALATLKTWQFENDELSKETEVEGVGRDYIDRSWLIVRGLLDFDTYGKDLAEAARPLVVYWRPKASLEQAPAGQVSAWKKGIWLMILRTGKVRAPVKVFANFGLAVLFLLGLIGGIGQIAENPAALVIEALKVLGIEIQMKAAEDDG